MRIRSNGSSVFASFDETARSRREPLRLGKRPQQVLVSRRWADLAIAPERFGLFIGERSLPSLCHCELAVHRSKRRDAAFANGYQLRDRTTVPLDYDGLAILDHVEQLREVGFFAPWTLTFMGASSVYFVD
jgi:hypothetical protein